MVQVFVACPNVLASAATTEPFVQRARGIVTVAKKPTATTVRVDAAGTVNATAGSAARPIAQAAAKSCAPSVAFNAILSRAGWFAKVAPSRSQGGPVVRTAL